MKLLSVFAALAAAGSAAAFAPSQVGGARSAVSTNMAASEELYIDEERRFLMNLILLGSGALTVGAIGVPYIAFFVPPGSGGGAGGISAKDALGNDIFAQAYLAEKAVNDRSLAQGLKGDATYLIVKEDKTLEKYGLNAGTFEVVTGAVVRGPAPLPLALAHCDVAEDGKILFSPWTEDDFRTGGKGWWN
ncbi:MAG: hypothetical protein SGARI_002687 [Bacillariaceae sp.]